MSITKRKAESGLTLYEFIDKYDIACSLQKSSLDTEDAIWLGRNNGDHYVNQCLSRMHLTQDMVAELIPLLQHFVDTGELP